MDFKPCYALLPTLLLVLALAITAPQSANAHSFLLEPEPYNQKFYTKNCKGAQCTNACPDYDPGDAKNTEFDPAVTAGRGEIVKVTWAKNNHNAGFVRLSITPVHLMMDLDAQERFAVYYGCWEQKTERCSPDMFCGTGNDLFLQNLVLPNVIPDGVYVLGYAWYGGLHFELDKGKFPDFHSCSFIRVSGGEPLGSSYQPFFNPDSSSRRRRAGVCQSAADDTGLCPKEGCTGPSSYDVPKQFKGGQQPEVLSPSDFESPDDDVPPPTTTPPTTVEPTTVDPTTVVTRTDTPPTVSNTEIVTIPATTGAGTFPVTTGAGTFPVTTGAGTFPVTTGAGTFPVTTGAGTFPVTTGAGTFPPTTGPQTTDPVTVTSVRGTVPSRDPGICKEDVCCASSCGICEGPGCLFRDGGPNACCPKHIRRNKEYCGPNDAPCVYESYRKPTVPPVITPTPSPSPSALAEICVENVCCPGTCGSCGGTGCGKLKGGPKNCCLRPIRNSLRYCGTYPAPCVLRAE